MKAMETASALQSDKISDLEILLSFKDQEITSLKQSLNVCLTENASLSTQLASFTTDIETLSVVSLFLFLISK